MVVAQGNTEFDAAVKSVGTRIRFKIWHSLRTTAVICNAFHTSGICSSPAGATRPRNCGNRASNADGARAAAAGCARNFNWSALVNALASL